jgi:putative spermidine/putrescine transport system substrate-binding protein
MAHRNDERRRLNRRALLGAAAALPGLLAFGGSAIADGARVVFASWGGSWEKAWRKAWADPFTGETGVSVVNASDNTLGKLQAMVAAGKTEWDVVEGNPELSSVGAEKGLLEKLDFDIIDRSKLMDRPEFRSDYSIPQVIFGRMLIYSKDLPEKPDSWTAFWDTARFPGKRAFFNRVESGVLEIALIADGVPVDQLYPLDIPRALNKLSEIRDHIIWYESLPQSEQLMRDGQASIGFLADGRALNAKNSGANVEVVPQASILTWSVMVVPKGAPNKDAAMRFLNFILQVRQQAAIAKEYYYGPVVPDAWKDIPQDRLAIISGGPASEGKAVFQSSAWWAANLETANEQFQQWKLG